MLDQIRSNAGRSWGVKLAIGLIAVVFIFWGIGSVQTPTGVVATVNGEQITLREFQRSYGQAVNEIQQFIPDVSEEMLANMQISQNILNELIIAKLFDQESKRTGIDISALELQNAIKSFPDFQDANGKFDKSLYEQIVSGRGESVAEFEAMIREKLLPLRFKQLLGAGLYVSDQTAKDQYDFSLQKRSIDYLKVTVDENNITVSQEELEKKYNEDINQFAVNKQVVLEYINFNSDKLADPSKITDEEIQTYYDTKISQFEEQEKVKARHILIQLAENASADEEKVVLSQIQAIEARIKNGEKFEDLAMEFGQDGTKENGGDLGWFEKNQMVQAFADAAFALNIGELSSPVKTNFGYHLILVEDKKEAHTKALDEVKEEIRNQIALEKVDNSLQDLVDTAYLELANNVSFEEIANRYNLSVEKTESLDQNALISSLGLAPASAEVIINTEKEQLVDIPLAMNGGLSIFKISDFIPAGVKPLSEVEEQLKNSIIASKAQDEAYNKAQNMLKETSTINSNEITTSSFFDRNGQIEGLGINAELAKEIFAGDDKNWKAKPYLFGSQVILARLAEIENADPVEFENNKQNIIQSMLEEKTNGLLQRYISMIYGNAEIEVLLPELFQSSNLN